MFSLNIHVSIIVCFKLVKKSLKDDLLDYLNSKQCILLTGAVNFANKPLIGIYKAGKLLRSDNITKEATTSISIRLCTENACFYHEVTKQCNYKKLTQTVLRYVQTWFCPLMKSNRHLNLSFDSFKCLLSNDGLKVSEEVEVFDAADRWIKFDSQKRRKFAIDLVELVRMPLLSSACLNSLLHAENSFTMYRKSKEYMKNILNKSSNELSNQHRNRCCVRDHFYRQTLVAKETWKRTKPSGRLRVQSQL